MNSRTGRWLAGGGLVLAAAMIWCRDASWLPAVADTLPLLAGLPLAWWLGGPWIPRQPAVTGRTKLAACAAGVAFAAGWMIPSLTLMTAAWTVLACCWAAVFHQPEVRRWRVVFLAALAFPWLVIEWRQAGWWFRLSSSAAAELFFRLLDMPVLREGTRLSVMGVPVQVEVACAGWNLLQLTLLAGLVLGIREIVSGRRFFIFLTLLPALSWVANTVRILVLTGIALSFDVAAADGAIHGITGLLVIAVVIGMARLLCALLEPPPDTTRITRVS